MYYVGFLHNDVSDFKIYEYNWPLDRHTSKIDIYLLLTDTEWTPLVRSSTYIKCFASMMLNEVNEVRGNLQGESGIKSLLKKALLLLYIRFTLFVFNFHCAVKKLDLYFIPFDDTK